MPAQAQVSVSATAGTPGPTAYTTLKAAFDAINAGTHQGAITVGLAASTTETATAALNAGTVAPAAYTAVLVQPTAASVTVTGAIAAPLIQLNGAANVTIDGRPGGIAAASPATTHLLLRNTSGSGQALAFTNDAQNNAVRYCQLQGTANSATNAVVVFTATNSAAGGGNSNNTLQYNSIGGTSSTSVPYNCVYSASGTGTNAGNILDGNNILDYFNATTASTGVLLAAGRNSSWTISNNAFYQSATRAYTNNNLTPAAISIGGAPASAAAAGSGYTLVGNRIGGGVTPAPNAPRPLAPQATYTMTSGQVVYFVGIALCGATGTGTTPSLVQGNTVQGIALSTAYATGTPYGMLAGIYLAGGDATVGGPAGSTVTTNGVTVNQANTIGSVTVANSITVTPSFATGSTTFGINSASAGRVTIQGNTVAGLRTVGSGTFGGNLIGIQVSAGTNTVTGNSIGNATTGLNAAGAVTSVAQTVRGISVTGGTTSLTGNTVTNLLNAGTSTATVSNGIFASGGVNTIGGPNSGDGNTVFGFTNASTNTSALSGAAVVGIAQTSTSASAQNVVGNTVYAIGNTAAGTSVLGIIFSGSNTVSNLVSRNLVYSLTGSASSASSLVGIQQGGGLATVANNMVRLGIDNAGASQSNGSLTLSGIYKQGGSSATQFVHNSVYIGGTASSGSANTAAFRRGVTTADVLANNALVNVRTGGTGQHVPVQLNNTTTLTVSNNVYYTTNTLASGSPAVATVGGTPTATISGDTGSQLADPQFVGATAATADLHINTAVSTPVEGTGTATYTTADDFDGETRSSLTPVDVGADAGNFLGLPVITYTPLANTTSTADRTLTATITAPAGLATGTNAPLLYYRKNSGAYVSTPATSTAGSSFSFTFSSAALGGLVAGDVVSYYVAAQDVTGGVTTNPAGGGGANPPGTVAPPTLNQYTILAPLSGPFNVGSGQTYTSLTGTFASGGLFAALNSAVLSGGNQVVNITSDLTETGDVALGSLPAGVTLTVQADGSTPRTISGTYAANGSASLNGLLRFNGTQGLTITGGAGTSNLASATRLLTFRNTGTAPVFLFYNGAASDNLTNVVVEGDATTSGSVVLDGSAAANSNISLTYNDLRDQNTSVSGVAAGASAYGVYGLGPNNTVTVAGNTIRNFTTGGVYSASGDSWTVGGSTLALGNLVYEEASQSGALTDVQLLSGNTHTISYNSLYQAGGSLSNTFTGILVDGGGAGHVVSNNTVGGTTAGTPSNGGSFSTTGRFRGIVLTVSTSGTATLVQGNALTGISSSYTTTTPVYGTTVTSYGIWVTAGAVTVGGSTPALGNLVSNLGVTYAFTGIYVPAATGTLTVQNNTVSNVAFTNNNSNNVNIPFFGLSVTTLTGATSNITANTVSNFTQTSTATPLDTVALRGVTRAIDAGGAGTSNTTITNNVVSNVGTGASGVMNYANKVYGIFSDEAGTYSVNNNSITGLTNNSDATGGYNAITAGISLENTAGTFTASGNTVSDVSNAGLVGAYGANAGSYVLVTGIYVNTNASATLSTNRVVNVRSTAPAGTISTEPRNAVAGLTVLGSPGGTATSTALAANNQVSLQGGASTLPVYGLLSMLRPTATGTANLSAFYNTLYVGGTTGTSGLSYGYYSVSTPAATATATDTLRNNLLYNEATGGTGNYAIGNQSTTSFADANYNVYVTGTAAQMARAGTTDYDLAGWQAATTGDVNSSYRQPTDADVAGSSANLFNDTSTGNLLINTSFYNTASPIRGGGTSVAVTTDYQGDARKTQPDIGSDEYSTAPLPVQLARFEAARQGEATWLSWTTASELHNRGFEVQASADGTTYRALAFVAGAGSSASTRSYRYADQEPGKAGLRYYRLRQLDLDGTATYSPVRVVQFGAAGGSLSAAPNPFGASLTLHLQLSEAAAPARLWLADALGRTVLTQDTPALPAGPSELTLPGVASLPPGVYVLHLAGQHLRVVKE